MKYYAIIVGGGSGTRMQQELPKQFIELKGKPILMHSMAAFAHSAIKPEIILVLNVHYHKFWEDLCAQHQFDIPHQLIKGGEQRFHSVKNGLKNIKSGSIVAIHDAVRPLVSVELINKSFEEAALKGNAVTGVPSKDSVRLLKGDESKAINRESVYLIQTPQTFQIEQLKKAYEQEYRIDFTDDASVVERMGYPIHLIEGAASNIKITYPEDLFFAEQLMARRA